MQDLNDEQIVKQVQKGEIDAFGVLIARFDKKLLRYISRFVFDINEAEDILQNVFIKTYSNLNGFNFQYKFSSWIYRIAHNEVVNYIRKVSKIKITIIDWDVFFPIDVSRNKMSEDFDKEKMEHWIKQNIKELDQKYKEVLALYYFENMSYKDIADILKIPIATVGVRIKRAKNKIKSNYNKTTNNKE